MVDESAILEIREIFDNLKFKESTSKLQKESALSSVGVSREVLYCESISNQTIWEIKTLYEMLDFKEFNSKKEKKSFINKLGDISFNLNNLVFALDAYIATNNKKMVKQIGEICMAGTDYYSALLAFDHLGGEKSTVFQIIKEQKNISYHSLFHEFYFDKKKVDKFYETFKEWTLQNFGLNMTYCLEFSPALNMAYQLSDKYDLGIGIAKGGLFSTFIFNKFGLETKVAQAHKKDKGTTFEWITPISKEEIEGKNIAVFDKDVVSGRTSKRVLKEIKKFKPKTLDLILNYTPKDVGGQNGILANVPIGFDNVFYPKMFSYDSFDKAVEELGDYL